eukprot:14633041-Alexandrium_andersonii.AAC.1
MGIGEFGGLPEICLQAAGAGGRRCARCHGVAGHFRSNSRRARVEPRRFGAAGSRRRSARAWQRPVRSIACKVFLQSGAWVHSQLAH